MLKNGGFTLPGESGYEKLTLELAEKWGADCIRDSDGTQLSDEILNSGIPIYSTLCLPRSINAWAKQNMDKLQRNFLMSKPVLAMGDTAEIKPLDGYFREQFILCDKDDPKEFWQVFDRTTGVEHFDWEFDFATETLTVKNATPYHKYTVNFLATRIWEEISMYNHTTNDWGDKEHLMAVEPRYPETQEALLSFLDQWCKDHPATSVVRFTSLFYNFVWLWGSNPEHRNLFTDWGSYDFTVNPVSLREFEKQYGYKMTSEDFINAGNLHSAHNPPTKKQLDWMEFTQAFVREFAKKCIDLVHSYGKKAYVFYDDSWIGLEPWNGHFHEFGFDGLIKCVFNAFEARLCAGVTGVETHELRLHPYLFPTGLTGEPSFAPGCHPEKDLNRFWSSVRRAMLRVKIDRIGMGGYLHLVEPFPVFQDEVARICDEFRLLRSFHDMGKPWESGIKVGMLQSWGTLRTWNCAGHMHEHPELPLNHIHEALASMPISLRSVSFAEVIENGVPEDVNVLINAGREGDAWSGGDIWNDPRLQAAIDAFVAKGGAILGVGEPAAVREGMRRFKVADAIGVDQEAGLTVCFEKLKGKVQEHFITKDLPETPAFHNHAKGAYPVDEETMVLGMKDGDVVIAANEYGNGRGAYLSGFTYSVDNARLLYRALLWLTKKEELELVNTPADARCECSYFPDAKKLVVVNNTTDEVTTTVNGMEMTLAPEGIQIIEQ